MICFFFVEETFDHVLGNEIDPRGRPGLKKFLFWPQVSLKIRGGRAPRSLPSIRHWFCSTSRAEDSAESAQNTRIFKKQTPIFKGTNSDFQKKQTPIF